MPLIASWTPQFAMFVAPYEWGSFSADINRFGRLLKGTLEAPPERILTKPTAADLRRLVASSEFLACDIETAPETPQEGWTGKDPTRARLKSIGFGNTKIALSHWWQGGKLVEQEIAKVLRDPKILKVFHNGAWFDIRVLARYGLDIQNWEDTRDLRRAQSATSRLSLRHLGSLCTDFAPWKEEDEGEKGYEQSDKQKLLHYNALDCIVTARVYRELVHARQDARVENLYQLHKSLGTIAGKMHTNGFRVHKQHRNFLAWGLAQQYKEQEQALLDLVAIPGFRCTPNDMRRLLYKSCETSAIHRFSLPDPIDPRAYTEKGSIKVDYSSLLLVVTDPECDPALKQIINLYWDAESTWKARSTFVTSKKVSHAIGKDHRIRPSWNSCGTDTGRFSCAEPNIMNLEQYLRCMYRAENGHVLVHADYSQLELRVMAAVAGDEELQRRLDIVNEDGSLGDVYGEDAKDWFNLPRDMNVKKLKPKARQGCKIIHLASQYAAGTEAIYLQALAQDQSMKYQTVALLHSGFKKTYCQTVDYWWAEQKRVQNDGYSESRIMNRRRVYPVEPPITEIANYPIQSTASDIVNLAMVELDARLSKYLPKARLVDQLHDAMDVEVRTKDAKVAAEIMKDVMEKTYEINGRTYKFPVEIKIGTHWDQL